MYYKCTIGAEAYRIVSPNVDLSVTKDIYLKMFTVVDIFNTTIQGHKRLIDYCIYKNLAIKMKML
jgi:hypothetical protein